MKSHGILASLTIAQAILESGWGESGLTQKANNLFGIKCGSAWRGDSITLPTQEWDGSKYITVNAAFRKYASWADSIADHTQLLLLPRYKNLVGEKDYKAACQKIREDGYATSPTYTKNLIKLIEQYNLNQYDTVENYSQPEEKKTVGTVTASVLNVRKGPGTNYDVIGTLKKGSQVRIASLQGDWYDIYYDEHGGYVHKNYIK
jgi:flagellum-specific peptidoglycan hydrolase FlgJ